METLIVSTIPWQKYLNEGEWQDVPGTQRDLTVPAGTAVIMWSLHVFNVDEYTMGRVRIRPVIGSVAPSQEVHARGINADGKLLAGSWSTTTGGGEITVGLQLYGEIGDSVTGGSQRFANWTLIVFPDPPDGCLPGGAKDCDDEIACTFDYCDGISDACAHESIDALCNDENTCTDDSCDPVTGCMNPPSDIGAPCGDPSETACDDPDTCDGLGACLANIVENDAPCPDLVFCNGDETCLSGVCVNGPDPCGDATICDEDNDECTCSPFDMNSDGVVSIIGDVPLFVACAYLGVCACPGLGCTCPGDCNCDGFLSVIGDVPCFVDCVFFGNCAACPGRSESPGKGNGFTIGGAVYEDEAQPLTSGLEGITVNILDGERRTVASTRTAGPFGLWRIDNLPEGRYTAVLIGGGGEIPRWRDAVKIIVSEEHQAANQSILVLRTQHGSKRSPR